MASVGILDQAISHLDRYLLMEGLVVWLRRVLLLFWRLDSSDRNGFLWARLVHWNGIGPVFQKLWFGWKWMCPWLGLFCRVHSWMCRDPRHHNWSFTGKGCSLILSTVGGESDHGSGIVVW